MRGIEMIKDIFRNLCESIEISRDDVLKINTHKKNITSCIDEYFDMKLAAENSQFIGSYGRNTAVFTDNIRLLTIIPEEMYWQLSLGINNILKEMKNALRKKYLSCDFSDNGNGLNINVDGNLGFEIVPGFVFNNGEYIYLCNNEWHTLKLKAERENFCKLNDKNNNNLVFLCRLLKIWKHSNNLDIGNILLDTFAYYFFYNQIDEKSYCFDNYDEMLVDFFNYLKNNCKKNTFISFDGETLLKKRIDISDQVFSSVTRAQPALDAANLGMYEEAVRDWRIVFGHGYI